MEKQAILPQYVVKNSEDLFFWASVFLKKPDLKSAKFDLLHRCPLLVNSQSHGI